MKQIVVAASVAFFATLIAMVGWRKSNTTTLHGQEQVTLTIRTSSALTNGSAASELGIRAIENQNPPQADSSKLPQQAAFLVRTTNDSHSNSLTHFIESAPAEIRQRLTQGGTPPVPAGTNTLKTPLSFLVNGRTQTVWAVSIVQTNEVLRVQFYPRGAVTEIPRSNVVAIGEPSLDWRRK